MDTFQFRPRDPSTSVMINTESHLLRETVEHYHIGCHSKHNSQSIQDSYAVWKLHASFHDSPAGRGEMREMFLCRRRQVGVFGPRIPSQITSILFDIFLFVLKGVLLRFLKLGSVLYYFFCIMKKIILMMS